MDKIMQEVENISNGYNPDAIMVTYSEKHYSKSLCPKCNEGKVRIDIYYYPLSIIDITIGKCDKCNQSPFIPGVVLKSKFKNKRFYLIADKNNKS